MDSTDYDQFIIQKYRLAVAIAVLKTKPKDFSTEEYLNQLKAKINEQNKDSDVTSDEVKICEDDFNFDDSDINTNNDDNSNDSVTILKNFDFINLDTVSKPTDNSFLDVMQMLNNIDDDPIDKTNINNSQITYFDGTQSNQDITFIDEDNTTLPDIQTYNNNPQTSKNTLNIDSQETEIYNLQDFTELNTHYSQSQDNFVISKNLLVNNKRNCLKDNNEVFNNTSHIKDIHKNNAIKEINNIDKDLHKNNIFDENINTINSVNEKRKHIKHCDENQTKRTKVDTKTTQNSNDAFLTELSSQSNNQSLNITIYSLNTNNSNKLDNTKMIKDIITTFDNFDNQETNDNDIAISKLKSKDVTQISDSYSLNEFEYHSQSFNFTNSFDKSNKIDNLDNIKNVTSDKNDNQNVTFDNIIAIDDNSTSSEVTGLSESQVEIVTFKVLEELSKVKGYLNRKDRLGKSDSGYRSFQRRYSNDSASQCSGMWINESAHCLVNFITTSPLVESTVDITDEISKVLGKLIDKLHEDEIYPNFLEKLLDTVEKLLTTVYEGRNYGENILDKDESIQRIYLLNRSSHIIKYSIEKITNILENTLQNLNNFELQRTDESENTCYIFYILEDLLKRHNKYKILSSQDSSQASQEEKVLKKSSLTEIWRKKWNLSKNEISEGSSEKICSLSKCRDVLNKIIVQAMEGYSLVSFAALQCFNLLQN